MIPMITNRHSEDDLLAHEIGLAKEILREGTSGPGMRLARYVGPYGPYIGPYGGYGYSYHRFGFDPDPNIRLEISRTRAWRKG